MGVLERKLRQLKLLMHLNEVFTTPKVPPKFLGVQHSKDHFEIRRTKRPNLLVAPC